MLEEPDFSASRGITGSAEQLAAVGKVNRAIHVMYDRLGMDYALGQKLQALLSAQGLQSITMELDAPLLSQDEALRDSGLVSVVWN